MTTRTILFQTLALSALVPFFAPTAFGQVIHRTTDIDIGETQRVAPQDGSMAIVKLLKVEEQRESVTQMLARALVAIEVNGRRAELVCGNYRLPVMVGGCRWTHRPCGRI